MGYKLWSAGPLLATVMLLLPAGCAQQTSPPSRLSDLCAALPITDVQTTYRSLTPSLHATKHLDYSKFHTAGTASCHYGPKDGLGGVALSVPIGGPVPDVAQLVGGVRAGNSQDLSVDSDKAFFVRSETDSAIAVDHGSTQFVLTWTPLLGAPNEMITQQQLVALARTVTSNLPTDFIVPQQDTAPACAPVQAGERIVGGRVMMTRGSANDSTLNCDFLGPTGIVSASATREALRFVNDQVRILRSSPRTLIDPPVDDEAALSALSRNSMYIEGYLTGCCALEFTHRAINDAMDYSSEFDAAQRQFVTSFIAAVRDWSRLR
ncbi:hypothetical protein ACX9NE_02335 [Mycobacterium sp. ML4]